MIENPQFLVAFYNDVTQEIRRLRDEQWKLSYYFILESTGLIYLLGNERIEKHLISCILVFLFVVQIGCMCVYLYHLYANHSYIGDARYIRRKLEAYFSIHEMKMPSGESIVPDKWKLVKRDHRFEFNTVVIPLALFVCGAQLFSIYFLSRVLFK